MIELGVSKDLLCCFCGCFFCMPKRFHGCQSDDNSVFIHYDLCFEILVEKWLDDFVVFSWDV